MSVPSTSVVTSTAPAPDRSSTSAPSRSRSRNVATASRRGPKRGTVPAGGHGSETFLGRCGMGARTRHAAALGSGLVLILGTLAPGSAGATSPPDWQPTATRLHIESPARAAIERAIDPEDYECGPTQARRLRRFAGRRDDDGRYSIPAGRRACGAGHPHVRRPDLRLGHRLALHAALPTMPSCSANRSAMPSASGTSSPTTSSCTPCTATCLSTRCEWPGSLLVLERGRDRGGSHGRAASIANFVANSTALDGGNNSIFTLNAFAFSGEGETEQFLAYRPTWLRNLVWVVSGERTGRCRPAPA